MNDAPYQSASDFDPRTLEGDRAVMYRSKPFHERVVHWLRYTFTEKICADLIERCDRFVEEALEYVQSLGYPRERVTALIDYVYNRPVGKPQQELGGTLITLHALSYAATLDPQECGEAELSRVWTKVDAIRAKQATRSPDSALPTSGPQSQATIAKINTHLAGITLQYLDGGWIVFTCDRTEDEFRSRNYVSRNFKASNGMTILTKNSPILIDLDTVALRGSFTEFDTKPTMYHIGTFEAFQQFARRLTDALVEMDRAEFAPIIGSQQD